MSKWINQDLTLFELHLHSCSSWGKLAKVYSLCLCRATGTLITVVSLNLTCLPAWWHSCKIQWIIMLLYLEKAHLDMTCASTDGCVIGAVQHSSLKIPFLELCVEFVLRFLTKLSLPMLSITFLLFDWIWFSIFASYSTKLTLNVAEFKLISPSSLCLSPQNNLSACSICWKTWWIIVIAPL